MKVAVISWMKRTKLFPLRPAEGDIAFAPLIVVVSPVVHFTQIQLPNVAAVHKAWERNCHGVPLEACMRMWDRWEVDSTALIIPACLEDKPRPVAVAPFHSTANNSTNGGGANTTTGTDANGGGDEDSSSPPGPPAMTLRLSHHISEHDQAIDQYGKVAWPCTGDR